LRIGKSEREPKAKPPIHSTLGGKKTKTVSISENLTSNQVYEHPPVLNPLAL
jgi:hypothetical protein